MIHLLDSPHERLTQRGVAVGSAVDEAKQPGGSERDDDHPDGPPSGRPDQGPLGRITAERHVYLGEHLLGIRAEHESEHTVGCGVNPPGEHESYLDSWLCREKKVGGFSLGRLVSILKGLGYSDRRKRRGYASARMGR